MDIELYKKTLKQRHMTYEDLATLTGLSLGCIKRIMAGIARYPRIDTIEAIENALEISESEKNSISARNEYSFEERQLINDYRELNQSGKRLISETIKTLLASSTGSGKKSV